MYGRHCCVAVYSGGDTLQLDEAAKVGGALVQNDGVGSGVRAARAEHPEAVASGGFKGIAR